MTSSPVLPRVEGTEGPRQPLSLEPDQHQSPPRPGLTCHQEPLTSLHTGRQCQPFQGNQKAGDQLGHGVGGGRMPASYLALGGRGLALFAQPSIGAHRLTAGLARLDVNLRLSQEAQGEWPLLLQEPGSRVLLPGGTLQRGSWGHPGHSTTATLPQWSPRVVAPGLSW